MEYALHLTDRGPLPADPREYCAAPWRSDLPEGSLRALYFGSEFCIDLLPGPAETEQFSAMAQSAGLGAVLLTPLVTASGLDRIEHLLTGLTYLPEKPAVVFNDWGVLSLVREKFPEFRLRAGRLINRGVRDPRLPEPSTAPDAGEAGRGHRIRMLMRRLGVEAIESDPDLEGGYLGGFGEGLQRTLYLPYAFTASGRNCLDKAEHAAPPEACFTKGLGIPCGAPCADRRRQVRRDDTDRPLWRQGNTIFSEVPESRALRHVSQADRIVLFRGPE